MVSGDSKRHCLAASYASGLIGEKTNVVKLC
jgi:hypothetical protein